MKFSLIVGSGRSRRELLVDLFSIFFGIGAWVAINGLWVELPLLVEALPEGWNLPSYLSVIIQIANIGPLIWSLARTYTKNLKEAPTVYCVLSIGVIATLLLVFFWKQTSIVFGLERSTALLSLVFVLSLVDCTSSVLFLPFMAVFRQTYLTSYLVGEGLSGLLPSLVALAQGVGGNPTCVSTIVNGTSVLEPVYPEPRFTVSTFFLVLFVMMSLSLTAFVALNYLPACRAEQIAQLEELDTKYSEAPTSCSDSPEPISEELNFPNVGLPIETYVLLVIHAWVCALSNGALPSIQSFACLPYGNTAYHLAVTLSSMANPLACAVAFFSPKWRAKVVTICSLIGSVIAGFILTMAALSPAPLLVGSLSGEILTVLSWVLLVGTLSYVKVQIATRLREQGNTNTALFWCGVATQIGSAIGSIVMFVCVNTFTLFTPYYPCAN